ncbi:MAG: hypothetical protein R2861_11500 [Desulfobacterales bacterium]
MENDSAKVVPVFSGNFSPDVCSEALTSEGISGSPLAGLINYLNNLGNTELEHRWQRPGRYFTNTGLPTIFSVTMTKRTDPGNWTCSLSDSQGYLDVP